MPIFERTWTNQDGALRKAYYFDYRDPSGRKRRRTFEKFTEAKKAEAAIKADLLRGEFRIPSEEKVSFDDMAKEYIETARINGKVVRNYENSKKALDSFFGGMTLREITVQDVESFKRKRRAEVAPGSVNRELMALSGIFTLARKRKAFSGENPVRDVEKFREAPIEITTLTPEEGRQLVAASEPRFRPIVVLALNTAMRKMEILGLRWTDIEEGVITLRKTKNKKVRRVPANALVVQALEGIPKASEWIFPNPINPKKHLGDVRPWYGRATKKAAEAILEAGMNSDEARRSAEKVKALTFHALRHSAITDMILGGIDVVTVGEVAGHSSIQITRRYCHPTADSRRRAVDVLAALHEDPEGKTATQERHKTEGVPATQAESTRYN